MKVLRVIPSMNPTIGGPCQGIRNSVPAMEQLGVHNEVVCLDNPTQALSWGDTFPVHALGEGRGPWRYNPALFSWLLTNFKRFDVVIIHGLWVYPSYAVYRSMRKYFQKKDKKTNPLVFVMPHGMLDPWFQRAAGRKLKALRNIIYWKLIEGKVINYADGVLFTCEEELLLAREPFSPYRPKKELNVGYGILPPPEETTNMYSAFRTICPSLKEESYLLFLSRIDVKKGVDVLISSYLSLKEQGYILPKLVIAGPGRETDYGMKMLEMAAEDGNILFPGMLTGDDKWGAFYNCDAFILPSHQENFGIAVVEALACGKPVLISNQVNICREIAKGGGGLVADDNQEGTKKMLIQWLSISTKEKLEMSNNARKVYKENYNVDQAARKMRDILQFELLQ
ncbi:glycosyltransferase [Persicitalea jodogahamensis]|uniref:Glycosyl transferase n=1 Tax=Persicitalea jodogahamensis TaxID=402147 RepID=A0A8J3D903_9BACT|nr:glycosyltransferase [Persicitalea jodogahamensis]GHB62997.1 glycosyl transferase [Persicitalea jodogahamensis]